jgi:hypothetical protein
MSTQNLMLEDNRRQPLSNTSCSCQKMKPSCLWRTTKGKPHLENLADITFTAHVEKAKITTKRQLFQQTLRRSKDQNSYLRLYVRTKYRMYKQLPAWLADDSSGDATKEKEANEAMSLERCKSCNRGLICTLNLFLCKKQFSAVITACKMTTDPSIYKKFR